jgi:hypothetical protein
MSYLYNTVPSFEWYLKNHLGSTMLVYGTQSISDPTVANHGAPSVVLFGKYLFSSIIFGADIF